MLGRPNGIAVCDDALRVRRRRVGPGAGGRAAAGPRLLDPARANGRLPVAAAGGGGRLRVAQRRRARTTRRRCASRSHGRSSRRPRFCWWTSRAPAILGRSWIASSPSCSGRSRITTRSRWCWRRRKVAASTALTACSDSAAGRCGACAWRGLEAPAQRSGSRPARDGVLDISTPGTAVTISVTAKTSRQIVTV